MSLEKSTPYRNAWYRDLLEKEKELKEYTDEKIAQAIELPEITSEDNGDLLAADDGSWTKSDKLKTIMNAGVDEVGKIPVVDSQGDWDLIDCPKELKSVQFVNRQALSDVDYASIKANTDVRGIYSDASKYVIFELSDSNFMQTEFDFVNYEEGLKAHVGTDKVVTITEIPKGLLVTVTESSGNYTADYTYTQIREAIENNKTVYVKLSDSNSIYTLYIYSATVCSFQHLSCDYSGSYNDNGIIYATTQGLTGDTFVFKSTGVTRSYVRYKIENDVAIQASSGSLNDKQIFIISKIPLVRLLYNNYALNLYYKDSSVCKYRDITSTYDCVVDLVNKTFTITTP